MTHKPALTPLSAMLAINIYMIGYLLVYRLSGSQNVIELWSVLNPVLTGAFALGAAWLLLRTSPIEEKVTWRLLGIGFGLWAIAECVSATLRMLGSELPRISWVDGLWLFGYLAVGAALEIRLRRQRAHLNWLKVAIAVGVGGVMLIVIGRAVVIPMLANYAAGQGLALLLNIAYPVLNATLVTGGLLVIFATDRQSVAQPWWFIGGALVLWAYSNLSFLLFSWVQVYGPNGFSTIAVDIPANLAYVVAGLGCMQAARSTQKLQAPMSASVASTVNNVSANV